MESLRHDLQDHPVRLLHALRGQNAHITDGLLHVPAHDAVADENFEGAMKALATLRAPVDAFFDKVLVNDADERVRANRLALLMVLRDACHQVADFSKIEG